ncbi:MAG: hypothetical protein JWQ27_2882 [Ferruginibacter sp.]|nr:hypothetical protein [Ferruginibacter sp.]
MKKLFSIILFLVAACNVSAQKQFVVDANAEMRELTGTFNRIIVSHAIDLYLSQSENAGLAVSASEDKYKAGIKTVIENNTLKIYYEGDRNWTKNRHLKVYVSFKELVYLEASGSSDVVVAGSIQSPSLDLRFSGASDFKGDVKAGNLSIDLSGASDITIGGTATTLNVESSGASDIKGYELVTETCNARVSGASDINITVNKEINARASGASSVTFKGNAVLKDFHSSGASSISRKDG